MLSVFIGYILELAFGKPKWMPDIARAVSDFAEKIRDYFIRHFKDSKAAGVIFSSFIILSVYLSARFLLLFNIGAVLVYFALSIKTAKDKLPDLGNSEEAIKAKIEFIAQNTAKDISGVLLYAFLGGPALAWIYKAVNAIDDVFIEKSNYANGMAWFNCLLSGALNYFPERICMPLLWAASRFCKLDAKKSFMTAWNEGRPNNAVAEALFAGSLGVQLGGLAYKNGLPVHKPYVGSQTGDLGPQHIENAARLMYVSSAVLLAALIVINYFWNVL